MRVYAVLALTALQAYTCTAHAAVNATALSTTITAVACATTTANSADRIVTRTSAPKKSCDAGFSIIHDGGSSVVVAPSAGLEHVAHAAVNATALSTTITAVACATTTVNSADRIVTRTSAPKKSCEAALSIIHDDVSSPVVAPSAGLVLSIIHDDVSSPVVAPSSGLVLSIIHDEGSSSVVAPPAGLEHAAHEAVETTALSTITAVACATTTANSADRIVTRTSAPKKSCDAGFSIIHDDGLSSVVVPSAGPGSSAGSSDSGNGGGGAAAPTGVIGIGGSTTQPPAAFFTGGGNKMTSKSVGGVIAAAIAGAVVHIL